jgi:hypothetical protein
MTNNDDERIVLLKEVATHDRVVCRQASLNVPDYDSAVKGPCVSDTESFWVRHESENRGGSGRGGPSFDGFP